MKISVCAFVDYNVRKSKIFDKNRMRFNWQNICIS